MAGSSSTNMSTWEPLSAIIESDWGDSVCLTLDDKLHISDATFSQTVLGPLNFNTSSTYTFAGPLNNTSTSVNTFAGPFNNTNTSTSTFAGPLKASGGIVALWDADNSDVTRIITYGVYDVVLSVDDSASPVHPWSSDTANNWAENSEAATIVSWFPINLPHGAVVTALRVTMQKSSGLAGVYIYYRSHTGTGEGTSMCQVAAGTTMAEVSTTSISQATIDNDARFYQLRFYSDNNTAEARIRAIQVEYTIKRPYP